MFFGRRNESFEPDQLDALLKESFEKKLGSFKAKCEGIAGELRDSQGVFIDVCNRFDALDAEPYMENLFWMNANQIKKQKGSYAKALKNAVEKFVLEAEDSPNSYDRYESVLSNAEEMNKEILKTNAAFKNVLYCYSHHINDFKRASLQLERLIMLLRSELDKRSKEYREYRALGSSISKFCSYKEELVALRNSIDALASGIESKGDSRIGEGEEGVYEKLKAKRAEYANAERDEATLLNEVYLLVSPLGRASKKFDHSTTRRRPLSPFVENPMEHMRSEADYQEFRALIAELKKSIESGAIDVKNADEVNRKIEEILSSDIYYEVNSVRSMKGKKLEIGDEIRVLETIVNRMGDAKKSKDMRAMEINGMENNVVSINAALGAEKNNIEKQFLQYYGRSVSIV